jgi:signal transduction histidine kinase
VTKVLSRVDLAVGVLLAAFGVALVSGLGIGTPEHAGPAAAAMVLLMTLPVAWRRQAPVAVAAVLAVGAVLNPLVIGDMIRCGPALPALLLCSYALGRYPDRLRRPVAALALALLLVGAAVQCVTDPNLDPPTMVALVPMILGLYGVGRLVRSRTDLAGELERRNEELRLQRERRALLAVQADRARIAEGLDASLNAQIVEIGAAAERGRRILQGSAETSTGSADAGRDFTAIQEQGRDALAHMRRVVGTLLQPEAPSTAPQPSLSQLDGLLARAGSSDVRLHVTGTPKALPSGLEVSAYRTLEHLLSAYGTTPSQSIDIDVDFATEALSLVVSGPAPPDVDRHAALASVRARIDLHHGSLATSCPGQQWETRVTLPLPDGA